MAAGLVFAVLGMATFTVIDNAFLPIVMHQQNNIDGFRASGMASTRAYLNGQLKATAPGVTILLAVMGAVLALLGAILAQERGFPGAWARPAPRPDRTPQPRALCRARTRPASTAEL